PGGAGALAGVEAVGTAAGVAAGLVHVERGPARVSGDALLVADPPHVGAGVAEHHRLGHPLAHDLPGVGPVVVGGVVNVAGLAGAPVVAVAAVGAVEPDGEDVAVIREQLAELVAVVGDVLGPAVVLVVPVPG